jgi:hypothetical protein
MARPTLYFKPKGSQIRKDGQPMVNKETGEIMTRYNHSITMNIAALDTKADELNVYREFTRRQLRDAGLRSDRFDSLEDVDGQYRLKTNEDGTPYISSNEHGSWVFYNKVGSISADATAKDLSELLGL